MMFNPRRARLLISALMQNPFPWRAPNRARGRRASPRQLYLELLEERVLLTGIVSGFGETVHHNTPFTFTLADFTAAFSSTSAGSLTTIEFTTLPANGTLTLNGTPINVGDAIDATSASQIIYMPDTNFVGADPMGWNGSDGAAFADAPADMSLSVQNAAPTLGNVSKFVPLNTATAFQASDFSSRFSDADPGDNNVPQAIQVVTLPSHGTLQLAGFPVNQGQTLSIDEVTTLIYVPETDYSGPDSYTWNASDGSQFAPNPAVVNLAVAVTPFVLDINKNANHNTTLNFTASDFTSAFLDASGASLVSIEFTALPSNGTLTLSGAVITLNQVIGLSDVASLSYTPAANFAGADVIGWNAADSSSFAGTAAHINITVSESAPTLSNVPKYIPVNTTTAFQASDFNPGFSDADPGDNLHPQVVQIVSLPTHGVLQLAGNAVTAGQTITIDQIANLTFVPAANYVGSDSFSWNASDGTQFAANAANVNLTVVHKPAVSNFNETLHHNTPFTFPLADFTAAFSDPDASLTNIEFTSLPAHGTLMLNASAVTLDQVISVSDLPNLIYQPALNYTGADAIGWNGGIGGVFADIPALINLDIQNVAPTITTVSIVANKNAPTPFTLANFTANFFDADPGDTLQSVKITTLPASGLLTLNSLPVAFDQVITRSDIPHLAYTPNSSATVSDSFTWEGSDGSLFATASAAVNLSIIDAAPTLSAISLSTAGNTTLAFKAANFTSAFHDSDPGDSLSYATLSLPTYGTLSLASVPIINSQVIPASQLGKLSYKPDKGFAGTDTFYWNASDGTKTASSISTVSVLVSGAAPSVAPIAKGLIQNATGMGFDPWDFTTAFKEPNIGPILQSITVVNLPKHGTLTLNGANVTPGQIVTATNIANLAYQPTYGFTGSDSFNWKGSDGVHTSGSSAAVSLKVIPQTVLAVYGNNAVIPSGNSRTSSVNFTDFGPLGIIANIDGTADTRTFTITNRSNSTINFTGGTHLVQITGSNPGDFSSSGLTDSISHTAVTSLAAGESATFTVTFKPTKTGSRTATIRIPVSSGSAYTFNVTGTGLNTFNNNVSGNALYGLQYAILKAGTGNGAPNGSVLSMNYTGYLFNGTRFDSSLNPGRTAFQFQLGASQVIKGWDPGLIGIKRGEIRVLVIPFSLAYGSSGSGSIPANATLIFIVQCLDIGLPRLGVAANGITHNITAGSKTASRTDGTLFPMMTTNQTASTVTFNVFNSGYQDPTGADTAQLSYTGATVGSSFLLSGTDASDFSLHTTSSNTFVVQFNRTADTALRTATVTVLTNDAINPTFTFTIQASSGYDDLYLPVLAPTSFPASPITSGDQTDLALPLNVRNIGNIPTVGNTDILIFAIDTSTQAQIPVTTLTNQNLGGIGALSSRFLTLHATLPAGFPAGTYELGVTLNPSGALIEISTANNTAITTQIITVNQGLADISGTLVSDTLPNSIISNGTVGGSVTLLVANPGPLPMPANQQVTIQIVAHNSSTSTDTVLSTSAPLSVASLLPGHNTQFTVPVKYTGHLPGGDYVLEARILPVQNLAESNTSNNLVTLGTAGQQFTLTSIAAFVDFTATLGTTHLPSTTIVSGDRTVLKIPVVITNHGNIPSTGSTNITIFALNTSTQASTNIVTLTNQNFAGLAPNASRTFTLTCTLPFGITTGTYELGVNLNPSKAIPESNYANNSASTTQTINVIDGAPDLTGALVSTTIPGSIVGGTPINSNLVVTVTNGGNILLPANQQITITVLAHNIALNHDTTLATTSALSVASLASGASQTFTLTINAAAGLTYGNYTLEALITPVQSLFESNTSNNLITTTNATNQHLSVFVAAPAYDLTPTLGAVSLPATTITSGDRTVLTLPMTVTNQGNITTTGTSDITIFALDTSGGTTTITTLTNQNLGGIAPNTTRTLTLSATLPFGFSSGTYEVGATLNPSHTITESSYTNNTVTTANSITVIEGLPDLTGVLVSTTVPANIIGGQPINSNLVVTVANDGNVLLPANQQITITVLAHNTDTGADTTLATTSALSVASLASGASSTFTVTINNAAGLTAGTYTLEAQLTPVQSLLESSTANDLVTTTNATNQQLSVAVAAPIYDLTPTLLPTTLPANLTSGDGTSLSLPLTITNLGNIASAGSSDIRIFALNTSTQVQTTITTLANQNLGGIAPNASRTLTLSTTLPFGFSSGTYEIGVTLNPSHAITESTYTNNTVTTASAINVTEGLPDLAGTLVSTSVKSTVLYFTPLSGSLVVQVANAGNIHLPANQQVTIYALAHSTTNGQDTSIGSATVSVAALAAGAARNFTISINNAAGLPADTFILEALLVPVPALTEAGTANNRITTNASGQNFSVVSNGPFSDFTAAFRQTSFPAGTIISGDGTSLSLPITVTNNGNVASSGTTDITVFAFNPNASTQTTITTLTGQNLGGMNPSSSKTMTLTATLPIGFSTGTYQLGVTLNPSHNIVENDYSNNSAISTQTITVDQGLAFLTGTLASSLPSSLAANATLSGAINITVANQGNVRLPAGQQITLTILAHNTDTNQDFTLATTSSLSIASLIVGGSSVFPVNVVDNAGLAAGNYVIEARVAPVQTLPEYASASNLITLTVAGAAVPLTIT